MSFLAARVGHQHQDDLSHLRGVGHTPQKKDAKRRVKAKLRDDRAEAVGLNDVRTMG